MEDPALTGRVAITIPSEDLAFRQVVERISSDPTLRSPQEIAERLRPLYPRVAVFERQLSGEPRRFYAYRDGHYARETREAWWADPSTPHARVSMRTGRITEVDSDHAHVDRHGCRAADAVGRHFTDFVAPDARSVAHALFDIVLRGEIRSRARIQAPNGSTVLIEFRAVPDGTHIDVAYRTTRDVD